MSLIIDDTNKDKKTLDNLVSNLNNLLKKYKLSKVDVNDIISGNEHDCDITSKTLEEYDFEVELYYEDENGNKIENFLSFTYDEFKSFYNRTYDYFIKENIAPYSVKKIGVYNQETGERVGELSLSKLKAEYSSGRLYRVGLLSDIHFNEGDTSDDNPDTGSDDGSEYYNDTLNVLKYFGDKTNDESKVDFISVAGDISTNSINHIRNFYLMLKKYAQVDGEEIPFFSCYGNHDHAATLNGQSDTDGNFNLWDDAKYEGFTHVRHWNQLMCSEEYKNHLKAQHSIRNFDHYINDIDDTGYATFSFEKVLPNNKFDVYIYLSVDYDSYGNTRATTPIRYVKGLGNEQSPQSVSNDDLTIDTTKAGWSETNSNKIVLPTSEFPIAVQFTNSSQRFLFDRGLSSTLTIKNAKVLDGNNQDITDELLSSSNPKVGIYGDDGLYHLSGNTGVTSYGTKVQLQTSSSFGGYTYPVTVYMDMELDPFQYSESSKYQENTNKLYEYTYKLLYPNKKPENRTPEECTYDVQLYDSGALLWLAKKLEQYKNHRVFIFTHQFFAHKAGNYNEGYENGYYSYAGLTEPSRISPGNSYCMCGIQFELMNYLNNKYSNTMWFTGHSHYKWEWQKFDQNINITNKEYDYICPLEDHHIDIWRKNKDLRYLYYRDNITFGDTFYGKWYESWSSSKSFEPEEALVLTIATETGKNYDLKVDANCTDTLKFDIILGTAAHVEAYDKSSGTILDSKDIRLTYGGKLYIYDIQHLELNFTAKSNETQIRVKTQTNNSNWLTMRINTDIEIISCSHLLSNGNKVDSSYNSNLAHLVAESNTALPKDPDVIDYKGNKKLLNINTGYNIHLPSTCRPIPIYQYGYGVSGLDSQGAIMDVYENYVDIRGIIFKDGNLGSGYVNKYIPIAQYRIPIPAK